MGLGHFRAALALAGLEQDQRLARLAQRGGGGDELGAVAQAFDIAGHDFGTGVRCQVVQEIGEIQAGLVAGVDEVAKAQMHHPAGDIDVGAHAAALRHQADVAYALVGWEGLEGGHEGGDGASAQMGQSHAVGADDAHAAALREVDQGLLPLQAFAADFRKARRIDNGRWNALGMAALEHGQHFVHGQREHGDVGRHGQRLHVGIAAVAGQLRVFGVDRKDLSVELKARQMVQCHAAYARGIARGTDHSDRAGVECGFKPVVRCRQHTSVSKNVLM